MINKNWAFGGTPKGEVFVRYCVQMYGGSCVYNEKGKPQGWHVCEMDGCLGIAFTLAEACRKGVFLHCYDRTSVLKEQQGEAIYHQVLISNESALRVNQICGFTQVPGLLNWIPYKPKTTIDYDRDI